MENTSHTQGEMFSEADIAENHVEDTVATAASSGIVGLVSALESESTTSCDKPPSPKSLPNPHSRQRRLYPSYTAWSKAYKKTSFTKQEGRGGNCKESKVAKKEAQIARHFTAWGHSIQELPVSSDTPNPI